MPHNNRCNQPSYPRYSHPYVHHQNYNQGGHYGHGGHYGGGYPAISYPGYSQPYAAPSYPSQSYGTPNVFSIIKTTPLTTDDNVCALNSYDTLTLESSSSDNLTITGNKADKKVSFALKNVVTSDTLAVTVADISKRASGFVTMPAGATPSITVQGNCKIAAAGPPATLATRVLLTPTGTGAAVVGSGTDKITVTVAAGQFTLLSDAASSDNRQFAFLLVN